MNKVLLVALCSFTFSAAHASANTMCGHASLTLDTCIQQVSEKAGQVTFSDKVTGAKKVCSAAISDDIWLLNCSFETALTVDGVKFSSRKLSPTFRLTNSADADGNPMSVIEFTNNQFTQFLSRSFIVKP